MDIVLVEDDRTLAEVIAMQLTAEGYTVRAVDDGEAALAECATTLPDLVLLDVMLPRKSGIEVCAELRRLYGPSPGVVILTALGSEADVVCGLEAGADDYVVKPIRPRELVARVRSLSRRLGAPTPSRALVFGPMALDPASRRLTISGELVRLTATEWDLLQCLVTAAPNVLSRSDLLQRVFDTQHAGYARNVDCHVTRLRRKLEIAGLAPTPIETVHGAGYRFTAPC